MFLFVSRYLFAKKSHSVVNIITTLSLVAISLPVAAVIILLSVFNGFGELVLLTNRVVDPDLTVVRAEGYLFDADLLDYNAIAAVDGVNSLSLVSEQTMLFENQGRQAVATLRGVDSAYLSVVPLDENIAKGEYRVSLGELDRMVLGNSLSYRLGATNLVDCFVDVYSLKGGAEFSSLLPMSNYTQRKIKVAGRYVADLQSEERYVITSLRAVQELTNSEGRASQLFIDVADQALEQCVKQDVEAIVGPQFIVKSRYDLNPMLYDIIDYEKWGVLFISVLIMILASFSLIGALSILIIEKRDNISTLRAMGASWNFIRNIFFGEGVLISGVGVGLGVILGCLVTLCQKWFGWVKIPAQTFLSDRYPVELLFSDVAVVVMISLSISVLLSYIVVRQMIKKE